MSWVIHILYHCNQDKDNSEKKNSHYIIIQTDLSLPLFWHHLFSFCRDSWLNFKNFVVLVSGVNSKIDLNAVCQFKAHRLPGNVLLDEFGNKCQHFAGSAHRHCNLDTWQGRMCDNCILHMGGNCWPYKAWIWCHFSSHLWGPFSVS